MDTHVVPSGSVPRVAVWTMSRRSPVIRQTVLDATDQRRLAEFYRQLFDLRYVPGDEPPGPGQPDPRGQDWLILTSPAGGPALAFQKVGEPPNFSRVSDLGFLL
jgi:Glyoxalase-like domain